MRKILKDNWFMVLIVICFVAITMFFTVDTMKNSVKGKTVDGKQIVATIGDKDITIDEFYDELAKSYEQSVLQDEFYKSVLQQAVPTTKELEERVKKEVDEIVAQYVAQGQDEAYLNALTKQYYGFDTYREYVTYIHKEEEVLKEYLQSHTELLEAVKENNPRIVRYVVITFADPKNPTEEELAKLQAAQSDWTNGMSFTELATKHSQDSNASKGGLFGYIDNKTQNIDEVFLNTSLMLKAGDTSEWVKSDEFGYFLIHCDTTDVNEMMNETGLLDRIVNTNKGLRKTIIMEKAATLNMEFANEEVKKLIEEGE